MPSWELNRGRFRGRTVLLTAGLPTEDRARSGFDPVEATEEAVLSLARAIFAEGGQLALIEDEVIAPLVGMVAGEYLVSEFAETAPGGGGEERPPTVAPVRLYRPGRSEEGGEIDDLARYGHLSIRNLGRTGFSVDDQMGFVLADSQPAALVCLGGGEDVESQCRSFIRLAEGRRAYILGTTGGAAARLAERLWSSESIRRIDFDVLAQLHDYAPVIHEILGEPEQERESDAEPQPVFLPYPLIMQILVEELIEPEEREPGRSNPVPQEPGPRFGGGRAKPIFRSA